VWPRTLCNRYPSFTAEFDNWLADHVTTSHEPITGQNVCD